VHPEASGAGDAFERARAIAARLGASMGGVGSSGSSVAAAPAPVAGQKRRLDEISGGVDAEGRRRKKVYTPRDGSGLDWRAVLEGPGGATLRMLEADARVTLQLRGRGSGHPDGDAEDELHVLVSGDNEDAVARGEAVLMQAFANPAGLHARTGTLGRALLWCCVLWYSGLPRG